VLAMRRVRGPELAISWLEAWLAPRFADVLAAPNPEGDALLKQIEAVHGHRAARARVEIFARRLPDALAGPMQAAAGSPALVIRRRYRGPDGGLYLVTESTHPEARFALNFEFARQ
jgi:GntR family transcriptional regulator